MERVANESNKGGTVAPDVDVERRSSGMWIVVMLLLASVALGVLMFRNLINSEAYLAESYDNLGQQGAGLSVEGCVDAVIDWRDNCEAVTGLCTASVSGMMVRCLEGQDRREFCAQVRPQLGATRFGVTECRDRQLDARDLRSACAASYRAIDEHCQLLRPANEAL